MLLIPTIFHNLIILECISLQQLLELVKKIVDLPIHPATLTKVLLRCSLTLDFVQAKCYSKYQNRKLANEVLEAMVGKMKEAMRMSGDRMIEFAIWLVENDRKH